LVYKTKGDFNMIGFLVPHNESKLPLYKFVVPVDKIEKMTAIDFFQNWMIKLKTD
jgi:endonuclease G